MDSYRRRRYRRRGNGYGEARKPRSAVSRAVTVISGVSFILFAGAIAFSGYFAGDTANWVGGLAMLLLLAAIGCLILAVREFRNPVYETVTKTIGLVASIASCAAWGAIYLIGMFLG